MRAGAVQKPAVKAEHYGKECHTFVSACDFARILVDKKGSPAWLGEVYLICPFLVVEDGDTCYGYRIRQSRLH